MLPLQVHRTQLKPCYNGIPAACSTAASLTCKRPSALGVLPTELHLHHVLPRHPTGQQTAQHLQQQPAETSGIREKDQGMNAVLLLSRLPIY